MKYSNPIFFDCQSHNFSVIPPCPLMFRNQPWWEIVYKYFTQVAESSPRNSIFSSCSLHLSLAFSLVPSGTESRCIVSIYLSHPKTFQPWCKSLQTKREEPPFLRVKIHSDTSCLHVVSLGSLGLHLGSQHPSLRKQVSPTPFPGTQGCLRTWNR